MEEPSQFERQIRLFGADGQAKIAAAKVIVVGVGGLGSHLVQQLAHLGVHEFQLIDPDTVELSNLNRLIGATTSDVGRMKTDVARELILSINEQAHIRCHTTAVKAAGLKSLLPGAHFVFGTVDNDAARLETLIASSELGVPYLDVATGIEDQGRVLGGRLFISAGKGCLICAGLLDQSEIRAWNATVNEREFEQSVYGVPTSALRDSGPAVVSLNGLLASLAVSEFTTATTGIGHPLRYVALTRRLALGALTVSSDVSVQEVTCHYCTTFRSRGIIAKHIS